MKFLVVLLSVLGLQSVSHADAFLGKVNYSQCSKAVSSDGVSVVSVCFATKMGSNGQYLILRDNKGKTVELQIVSRNATNAGINPNARASELQLKDSQGGEASATLSQMNNSISLQIHYGSLEISASQFEYVVNTMSAN